MAINPYEASKFDEQQEAGSQRKTRTIKRFAPLQLGLMMGAVYLLISLLVVPFLLIGVFAGGVGGAMGLFAIFLPILYGIVGFIGGVIGAFVYNLCAKLVGGIQVEIE